jgi:uncharacterized protein with PQ loop repeat
MKKYNNNSIRLFFHALLFFSFMIFLFYTVVLNFMNIYMKKKEEFSSSPDYIDYYNNDISVIQYYEDKIIERNSKMLNKGYNEI